MFLREVDAGMNGFSSFAIPFLRDRADLTSKMEKELIYISHQWLKPLFDVELNSI